MSACCSMGLIRAPASIILVMICPHSSLEATLEVVVCMS